MKLYKVCLICSDGKTTQDVITQANNIENAEEKVRQSPFFESTSILQSMEIDVSGSYNNVIILV